MSEFEQAQDRSPRFSKAILGRILAVGFFVILGTFAVVQSMRGTPLNAVNATVNLTPADSSDKPKTNGGLASDAAAKVKTGVANTANKQALSSIDTSKTANAIPTGFQPTTFAPPTGGLKTTVPNNKSPAASTSSQWANKNSFDPEKTFTPPANKNLAANMPVVTSKPIVKPPTRYAQVNTGVPIIGNNSGFSALKETPSTNQPKVPTTTFGDNPLTVGNKLNIDVKTSTDAAASLKSIGVDGASDLLRIVRESVNEKSKAAGSVSNQKVGGGFGTGLTKTTGTFGGPPSNPANSSFGAPRIQPKIQTSFGDRPTALSNAPEKAASSMLPAKQDNLGLGGRKSPQTVLPITSRIQNNSPAKLPKTSPFGDFPAGSSNTPTQRPIPSTTQKSIVPIQPISTNFSSSPPKTRIGDDNVLSANSRPASTNRLNTIGPSNNINSRLGTGNSILSSSPSSLTKNVPGDRQLDGLQAPALTVEKLSPREIQVNQTANFEIVVKNVGRVPAEDVRVIDEVPAGTEFQGSTPEPIRMAQNRNIEWDLGRLRPGQEKRIKLQLRPVLPGEIGSVARVTFSTQASMRTLVTKPVLEIVNQTNPTHLIGDDVVLDVVVTNRGDGPAKNVMIQQDVPKQLEFPDGLPGGSRGIEYEIGTLLPGKSRRVKLALKAANIGKIQIIMYASADGGLRAKHQLPIEVVAPKLVARSHGPTRRFLKRNVTHQFSVSNQGTAKATNVELIARLPHGLKYIQSDNQGLYRANTHAVYWSLAELARGVEAIVELETIPVDVGNQPIKFESSADLQIRSNVEQALSVEHLVDIFFEIDDVVDPIEIGSDTSYRLRIVNQGTKAAANIQLDVDFSTGLKPTSVDGSLRHNIRGQKILFEPINSMGPGDEVSIVIHGKGQSAGDHRVVVNMKTDGRTTTVSKQETTRVYADR